MFMAGLRVQGIADYHRIKATINRELIELFGLLTGFHLWFDILMLSQRLSSTFDYISDHHNKILPLISSKQTQSSKSSSKKANPC